MPRKRAEAVLSPGAKETFDGLKKGAREAVASAIDAIEDDPSWRPPLRFLAPARSKHHGCIVDLVASPYGIIYKIVDDGLAVEILVVQPMIF